MRRSEEQLDLFPTLPEQTAQPQPITQKVLLFNAIHGLRYIPDYITEDQHDWLLDRIDEQQWLDDLKRRV
ncbi:alpha-ketoglutarate-dependent dioxygenase AlkB, partial [Candidatus Poribacteria bacterium]